MGRSDLIQRLRDYARQRELRLGDPLGSGVHGIVFAATSQRHYGWSALKAHETLAGYLRERDTYLRLQQLEVTEILGSQVPILLNFDDDLAVIEMSIVTRPFVLDFAGAYLDQAPGFSEEVLADWRAEKEEQFGSRWPEVEAILRQLENFGIHMIDVNPGNISFPD